MKKRNDTTPLSLVLCLLATFFVSRITAMDTTKQHRNNAKEHNIIRSFLLSSKTLQQIEDFSHIKTTKFDEWQNIFNGKIKNIVKTVYEKNQRYKNSKNSDLSTYVKSWICPFAHPSLFWFYKGCGYRSNNDLHEHAKICPCIQYLLFTNYCDQCYNDIITEIVEIQESLKQDIDELEDIKEDLGYLGIELDCLQRCSWHFPGGFDTLGQEIDYIKKNWKTITYKLKKYPPFELKEEPKLFKGFEERLSWIKKNIENLHRVLDFKPIGLANLPDTITIRYKTLNALQQTLSKLPETLHEFLEEHNPTRKRATYSAEYLEAELDNLEREINYISLMQSLTDQALLLGQDKKRLEHKKQSLLSHHCYLAKNPSNRKTLQKKHEERAQLNSSLEKPLESLSLDLVPELKAKIINFRRATDILKQWRQLLDPNNPYWAVIHKEFQPKEKKKTEEKTIQQRKPIKKKKAQQKNRQITQQKKEQEKILKQEKKKQKQVAQSEANKKQQKKFSKQLKNQKKVLNDKKKKKAEKSKEKNTIPTTTKLLYLVDLGATYSENILHFIATNYPYKIVATKNLTPHQAKKINKLIRKKQTNVLTQHLRELTDASNQQKAVIAKFLDPKNLENTSSSNLTDDINKTEQNPNAATTTQILLHVTVPLKISHLFDSVVTMSAEFERIDMLANRLYAQLNNKKSAFSLLLKRIKKDDIIRLKETKQYRNIPEEALLKKTLAADILMAKHLHLYFIYLAMQAHTFEKKSEEKKLIIPVPCAINTFCELHRRIALAKNTAGYDKNIYCDILATIADPLYVFEAEKQIEKKHTSCESLQLQKLNSCLLSINTPTEISRDVPLNLMFDLYHEHVTPQTILEKHVPTIHATRNAIQKDIGFYMKLPEGWDNACYDTMKLMDYSTYENFNKAIGNVREINKPNYPLGIFDIGIDITNSLLLFYNKQNKSTLAHQNRKPSQQGQPL